MERVLNCILKLHSCLLQCITGIFYQEPFCIFCAVSLSKHLRSASGNKPNSSPQDSFLTTATVTPVTSESLSQGKQISLRLGSCVASAARVCGGGKCSSHARRGPALGPQQRLYEPAEAVVQEHVVLIGSRARPRPVKAPALNNGRSGAATRTTWQIKKKKQPQSARVPVAALSHVLSCGRARFPSS